MRLHTCPSLTPSPDILLLLQFDRKRIQLRTTSTWPGSSWPSVICSSFRWSLSSQALSHLMHLTDQESANYSPGPNLTHSDKVHTLKIIVTVLNVKEMKRKMFHSMWQLYQLQSSQPLNKDLLENHPACPSICDCPLLL